MSGNGHQPRRLYDDDGDMIEEPRAIYPAWILELEDDDEGWDDGYRYIVEFVNEDQVYFRSWEEADHFSAREGLEILSIPEMIAVREAMWG